MRINHNINSMYTQGALVKTNRDLSKSLKTLHRFTDQQSK